MSDIFDIEMAMEFTGGDEQLLGELVGSMLEETPRLMDRIELAITESNREALRIEAHTLKGSVAMVGATDVSEAAAKLESMVRNDDLESVGALQVDLQTRIDLLMDALEIQLSELSGI